MYMMLQHYPLTPRGILSRLPARHPPNLSPSGVPALSVYLNLDYISYFGSSCAQYYRSLDGILREV